MYLSLYRKYRPGRFSEISGQRRVVEALVGALESSKVPHAFLFSGPRGCGKTSAARLLAKRLNCSSPIDGGESCGQCPSCEAIQRGDHLDVVEIDGASNRGIEEIRALKDQVALAPFQAPNKVYIIDEVHMLTEAAFNALLKTLEEPPGRVYFVLATTEPQKVPVTIRSRCVHFPFQRISTEDIKNRLAEVASLEGIEAEEEALWELARNADGALRDALSMMEQAMSVGAGRITLEAVSGILGGCGREALQGWVERVRTSPKDAFLTLMDMMRSGSNLERFVEGLFLIFRDMMLVNRWGSQVVGALGVSPQEGEFLCREAPLWDQGVLRSACSMLADLMPRARQGMRADVFAGLLQRGMDEALLGGVPQGEPAKLKLCVDDATGRSPVGGEGVGVTRFGVKPLSEEGPPSRSLQSGASSLSSEVTRPVGVTHGEEGDVRLKGSRVSQDLRLSIFRRLLGEDPALGCALMHCGIYADGSAGYLDIPDDPLVSSYVKGFRGKTVVSKVFLEVLGVPLDGVDPEGSMEDGALRHSPKTLDDQEDEMSWEQTISFQQGDLPVKAYADETSETRKADVGSQVDGIRDALSWLDGEVLYVRMAKEASGEDDQQEEEAE
ncbi:MAG: DNA polymerase III subunit gamma/tau [Thermanaerothrix sp.]|nr:DNA polymerase III subunit gamma/tau [Thermanaerothrix sp.]